MTKKKNKRRINNYRVNSKGRVTGHGGYGYGSKIHSTIKRIIGAQAN